MKLLVERGALLNALSHAQNVVEKRNTIPILSNIKIATGDDNSISLTATDMELTVIEQIPANIDEAGVTTVSAHVLHDIVRKLPEGSEVSLTTNDENSTLLIKAGKAKFNLSCLPVDDFPVMEAGDFEHTFTIPAKELHTLLSKTQFAISHEETRYYLNGVYFHAHEDKLRAVATDGHKMALLECPLPQGAEGIAGVIIPKKTVGELIKLVEKSENVEISMSETKIQFSCGEAVLLSKLIDGTFPDYPRVIPEGNDKMLEVSPKTLASSIDRISTILSDRVRTVKIALEAGIATVSAASAEQGDATEQLEVSYGSDAIEIGFNARYIMDMLAQIDDEIVQFAFSDSTSPALVHNPSIGALYVVMPMRV